MIQAKIIADSISPNNHRLTTLEVIMPRYILAEFNTHRILSKNSASSRAIPFNKMIKEIEERPFIPYAWQKDHSGMQGNEYIENTKNIEEDWLLARDMAVHHAKALNAQGGTKQLCNRLLEPFIYHKVLVSGTEWENFFNLRCPQYTLDNITFFKSKKELKDFYKGKEQYLIKQLNLRADSIFADNNDILAWLKCNVGQADIHIMSLAEAIYDAINESTPKELKEGEWHIPYGDNFDEDKLLDKSVYGFENSTPENQGGWTIEGGEEAYYYILNEIKCKISIARCARLSYQTLGDNPVINYEKDLELYEVLSKSGHWSPFEHVARVMTEQEYHCNINGKIHDIGDKQFSQEFQDKYMEKDRKLLTGTVYTKSQGWCRNFRGFIQQRALID